MEIKDLNSDSRKVSIEAKVVEKGEARDVNTRYGQSKVTECTIEDDSGSVVLVLWGDDADKINEGDTVRVENGYVKEWNNVLQLNVGKYGKLIVNPDSE